MSEEEKAYQRYLAIFMEMEALKEDIRNLDLEFKNSTVNEIADIRRLASLAARDACAAESAKFKRLVQAAFDVGQGSLFPE